MDFLDQFASPLVAALAVFAVHLLSRGRFIAIERRLDRAEEEMRAFRAEVRGEFREVRSEFQAFRAEVRSEFLEVRSEIAAVRSDLTRVALALRAVPETEAG